MSAKLTSTNIGIANVQVSDTAASNDQRHAYRGHGLRRRHPPKFSFRQRRPSCRSAWAPQPAPQPSPRRFLTLPIILWADNRSLLRLLTAPPPAAVKRFHPCGHDRDDEFRRLERRSGAHHLHFRLHAFRRNGRENTRLCRRHTTVKTGTSPSGNDAAIVIGGLAGSIAFGQATTIGVDTTAANYIWKMSILVADSNGNAVPGAVVSLGVWPIGWSTGPACTIDPDTATTGTFWNEDDNENLILDAGEDGTEMLLC